MMRSISPHMLPVGEPNPPNEKHSVSVSLPTWESVAAWGRREQWLLDSMHTCYPRFGMHPSVRKLMDAVCARLRTPKDLSCLIFPSADAAARCTARLSAEHPNETCHTAKFQPHQPADEEVLRWATFFVVLFPQACISTAMHFWKVFGDGIAGRHAEHCLRALPSMDSYAKDTVFETSAPCRDHSTWDVQWVNSAAAEKESIRSLIARLVSSDQPGYCRVSSHDVFLYPKGMCAIAAVARALVPHSAELSEAVIYGWPYAETPLCVKESDYKRSTLLSAGSKHELDELESSLAAGRRIQVLFCEVPSNPQLRTPDLPRIHALAAQYDFIVAVDDTLGTFVNIDVLPYVDVIMTSLTKIFSGMCNVMGGSVVVNPQSSHYTTIHSALTALYEDTYFPLEAMITAQNASDFEERVKQCSASALTIANLLAKHSSVAQLYYPSLVPSRQFYDQVRRKDGGYGYLLSIVFHKPETAIRFYDVLDICKGPSVGTNFSLAIPYSLLAHFREQDWAESEGGIDRHMVRISVGLEKEEDLTARIQDALTAATADY
ncbi:pyridoxal phosphate-dependent transferase [Aspergillus caelatus]|uniref:Pyridoxal phosphate-dependent transferase n=1 Tax=Aspergillus caelatus TaxID=61420 RepID=A0A5N6ZSP9_9EURO|nr:pyridoxal phosphate-dependent transferase [Aspergillus caelatus]KAE8360604.1 pyridoxal phosphate-dependent transferase [Aspergillus caelatus]